MKVILNSEQQEILNRLIEEDGDREAMWLEVALMCRIVLVSELSTWMRQTLGLGE